MFTRICCVCHKIWSDSEQAWIVAPPPAGIPQTHGYCPPCAAIEMQKIEDYYGEKTNGEIK